MGSKIRLATPEDACALCHLNDLFNGPGATPEEIEAYLQSNPRELIAVADLNGQIVGFTCAQITSTFYESKPMAEITELYILPEHRKSGIATQLITYLENLCIHDYGVESFKLLTGKENFPAQKFYEKLGYKQDTEVLYVK